MTQRQLDRAVARTTGDTLITIRSVGFSLAAAPTAAIGPEGLHLAVPCPAVPCPRCGAARRLPCDRHGPAAMAECVSCDLLFDYRPADVRVAAPTLRA